MIVDTSVWIDYFRSGQQSNLLDDMIDEDLIATNDVILSELIPFLKIRHQNSIIGLLWNIRKLDVTIDWNEIMDFHYQCLQTGLNGVGIPDLIICQNAVQNQSAIYSLEDGHFRRIEAILDVRVI